MILIRRSITRPLTLLANATRGFADSGESAGDAEQFDDITMLGLTYKGDGSAKPDARS